MFVELPDEPIQLGERHHINFMRFALLQNLSSISLQRLSFSQSSATASNKHQHQS
jgi:hypothetical protein